MASFNISFLRMMGWEGYCWEKVPGDNGGETFAGISRVYNPKWEGWRIIDNYKAKVGIENKKAFQDFLKLDIELRKHVMAFYERTFNSLMLDRVNCQSIVDQIYQAFVNLGTKVCGWVQLTLNDINNDKMYPDVKVDGEIGYVTLNALNIACENYEKEFVQSFGKKQIAYYQSIVQRNAMQGKFLNGWIARAKDFMEY